jgi:hypothetical protein
MYGASTRDLQKKAAGVDTRRLDRLEHPACLPDSDHQPAVISAAAVPQFITADLNLL